MRNARLSAFTWLLIVHGQSIHGTECLSRNPSHVYIHILAGRSRCLLTRLRIREGKWWLRWKRNWSASAKWPKPKWACRITRRMYSVGRRWSAFLMELTCPLSSWRLLQRLVSVRCHPQDRVVLRSEMLRGPRRTVPAWHETRQEHSDNHVA